MKWKKSLILIIIWTIVIIPLISVWINCCDWYNNGANIAWEGEEWVYGLEAVKIMLRWVIAFYFPLFIMWAISFIIAVIITVLAIIKKNNYVSYNKWNFWNFNFVLIVEGLGDIYEK